MAISGDPLKFTYYDIIVLTRRGGPVRVNSNFPLNWPSAMSSSYLLQGPRVGRRERSTGLEGGRGAREREGR